MKHRLLWVAWALGAIVPATALPAAESTSDLSAVISRADLDYATPVTRSEEGMPVGNGRMGSLVWTTPSALKFQINRCDVFAVHSGSVSFPRADTDYASGCAYVDINFVAAGDDVFSSDAFRQHLSVYEGLVSAQGRGVTARVVAWPTRDVFAIEIDDQRATPEPINIDLRMLRYVAQYHVRETHDLAMNHAVKVRTAEHTATSQLHVREGRIVLTQRFEERDFHDASAVAIGVVGRTSRARYLNESTVQLTVAAGNGRCTVLIASAATFDRQQDVAALALAELDAAAPHAFERLRADTRDWWRDYWSRGHIRLHSADGQADLVGQEYAYFLYLMGASSRGKYPPRFGGMLWRTTGDMSRWGSQYWWSNTGAYYTGLMAANRPEILDPLFSLYSGMHDACATAARQQWGSQGIWIPEITFFDGPEALPADIAAELQDLVLLRKPFEQRSARFRAFSEVRNRHHARWNFHGEGQWVEGRYTVPDKGRGIFGSCTHILGGGVRIGHLFWQRYESTGDRAWLEARAYPMLKGMAEFYRNFPHFKKEADGKYHIHHVNSGEQAWDASDTIYEVNCLHLIFPLAVRAAEILDVDPELRAQWREIEANLVPAAGSLYRGGYVLGFTYGTAGAIEPLGDDRELKRKFLGFTRPNSWIDPAGGGGAGVLRNRLRLREGPGAIDAEHIGALSGWLHEVLIQNTADPGEPPVLRLFQGWPRDWDAEFTLLAPGAFEVSARQEGGQIRAVEIVSRAGAVCSLVNPWGEAAVRVERENRPSETVRGNLVQFTTAKNERVSVRLADQN